MLFSGLPPAGLAAIIDSMQPQMVMAGKDIIKQVCKLLFSFIHDPAGYRLLAFKMICCGQWLRTSGSMQPQMVMAGKDIVKHVCCFFPLVLLQCSNGYCL
jgi:hypothetical protein